MRIHPLVLARLEQKVLHQRDRRREVLGFRQLLLHQHQLAQIARLRAWL